MSIDITFLGGNNDDRIGGNSILFETEKNGKTTRVLNDLGDGFVSKAQFGIESSLADARKYFDHEDGTRAAKPLDAVNVTHAHRDHFGGLLHMMKLGYKVEDVPIHADRFTMKVLMKDAVMEGLPLDRLKKLDANLKQNMMKPKEVFKIGDLSVEPMRVGHSIAGAMGLLYTDDKKNAVLHTGDYRLDQTQMYTFDMEHLKDIGSRKHTSLTLLSESTNALREVEPGKKMTNVADIRETWKELMKKHSDQRIFSLHLGSAVETFVGGLAHAAAKEGKTLVLSGTSIKANAMALLDTMREEAAEKGIPYEDYAKSKLGLSKSDPMPRLIDDRSPEVRSIPEGKQVIIGTGGFAQELSMGDRLSKGQHSMYELSPKDVVAISQGPIPVDPIPEAMAKMTAGFKSQTPNVITPKDVPGIYSSGHAKPPELREVIKTVQPTMVVSIHGSKEQRDGMAQIANSVNAPSFNPDNMGQIKIADDGKISSVDAKPDDMRWIGVVNDGPFYVPRAEYSVVNNNYKKLEVLQTSDETEEKTVGYPTRNTARPYVLSEVEKGAGGRGKGGRGKQQQAHNRRGGQKKKQKVSKKQHTNLKHMRRGGR